MLIPNLNQLHSIKNIEVETEIPALDTTKMNRYDYRNYIRTGILPTPYPKG